MDWMLFGVIPNGIFSGQTTKAYVPQLAKKEHLSNPSAKKKATIQLVFSSLTLY